MTSNELSRDSSISVSVQSADKSTLSQQARDLISRSSGAERTAVLAATHAKAAKDSLLGLPESDARTALEELTDQVLARSK